MKSITWQNIWTEDSEVLDYVSSIVAGQVFILLYMKQMVNNFLISSSETIVHFEKRICCVSLFSDLSLAIFAVASRFVCLS